MLKKMVTVLAGTVLTVTVSANVQASTITVEKGDSLWAISQANNMSVDDIKMLNNLTTDLIHPGDLLTVAPQQYTVQLGDTLSHIAMKHQVTVSQLKEWNQLHTDLIHPGLKLSLFEGATSTASTSNKEEQVKSVSVTTKESTATAPAAKAAPVTETKKDSTSAAPAQQTQTQPESTPTVAGVTEMTMKATAYTAYCEGCIGITKTGIDLRNNPDAKVIAVDPTVIPLGSKVYVEGYGEAIAGDIGGAIKGNRIDVFIPNEQDAINFGVQQLKVKVLN